jgi:hypothetical protein
VQLLQEQTQLVHFQQLVQRQLFEQEAADSGNLQLCLMQYQRMKQRFEDSSEACLCGLLQLQFAAGSFSSGQWAAASAAGLFGSASSFLR